MVHDKEHRAWFVKVEWKESVILIIAACLNNFLSSISPPALFGIFLWRKQWKLWFVEVWVIALILILCICLFLGSPRQPWIWWIALYALFDATGATLRDIVAAPQIHRDAEGGYVEVHNATRWLLMAAINVVEVILGFAVLALYYGDQFKPAILDSLSAVYFSAVTFFTLGYGDVLPKCSGTKILVCFELLAFLTFLLLKVPMAISVMRVKEKTQKPKK